MALILTDIQKVTYSVAAVSVAGNAAPIENVIWSSSNPSVLTVTANADGLSAVAETTGALGTAQVQVVADARIGEGVVELTGIDEVTVIASEAATLAVTAGVPETRL